MTTIITASAPEKCGCTSHLVEKEQVAILCEPAADFDLGYIEALFG